MNRNAIFPILVLILLFGLSSGFNNSSRSVKYPKGVVFIEAESTTSNLDKWVLIGPDDPNYVKGASGERHIEFTANTKNGGPATSPLEYTFTVPETGTYRLLIRCRKRLEGEPGDKCNDGWVKLAGNFTTNNDVPTEDLMKNEKFFGGDPGKWGWAEMLDWQGHIKRAALYNLKKGETYTFTLSGRSIRWNVDAIIFFNTEKFSLIEVKKMIDPSSVDETPLKWNMKVDGYSEAYYDQGNKAFAINPTQQPVDKWAAATRTWTGKKGKYTMNFTTLCELDGECAYKVLIDGKGIVLVTNPRIFGTDKPDYTPHTTSVKDVMLNKGSVIKVEFIPHSNQLIPENDAYAFARARWRDIEFVAQ